MTSSPTTSKPMRDSNIELLRILCMLFIVLSHFIEAPGEISHAVHLPLGRTFRMFCIPKVAVNTFILISGYFGIRLKLKNVLNLYFSCAFYGLIGYLVYVFHTGSNIGFSIINNSVFIFSHNTWWFISGYLYLLLLSPLLNAAIDRMSKQTHLTLLILMGIATCYFGWFQHTDMFNSDGFCFDQFLIMYMIGAYMHKYFAPPYFDANRRLNFALFLIPTASYIVLDLLPQHIFVNCYLYNSPFCILASVGLMGFVLSFHFKNRYINWIATSALAAYLLQDQYYMGQQFLYPLTSNFYSWLETYYSNHINYTEPLIAVGLAITFFITAIAIDKVRIFIMQPVWWCYEKVVTRYSANKLSFIERICSKN